MKKQEVGLSNTFLCISMTNYGIFPKEYLDDKTLRIQPWIKENFATEFNGNTFNSVIYESFLDLYFFPVDPL